MANQPAAREAIRFLVDSDWLAAHLDDPDLRIFDCTVKLIRDREHGYRAESGRADWQAGHIPGAGFIDLPGALSDRSSRLRFMMPPAAQFAAAMSSYGVGDGARVVLYSAGPNWWATRLWWMLRAFGFDDAAVLDGGLEKWRREGRPLAAGEDAYPPAAFTARPRDGLIADRAEVLAAIDDPGAAVVNALSARQHSGESEIHYGRPGRIAGSVNLPANQLLDPATNAFLAPAELRAKFAAIGAAEAATVITYCGGGIAASSDAFALAMLGHPNVKLYDASLSEWAADPDLPMETG